MPMLDPPRGRSTTRRIDRTSRARSTAPTTRTRRTNSWTHCVTRNLPKRFYDQYPENIKKAAEFRNIESYQEEAVHQCEGKQSTRVGSSEIKEYTRRNYESDYKQLWNF